ncbi:hypothetical protein KAW50_01295 [candidate division WOR-3 bacterium]|nr:hypothetical protein [candidate division WOR-3 bacterium]
MWILLSVLMIGVPGESTSLVNLQGKWTAGLKVFGCDQYSISWRPFKTVMIGVEGSGWIDNRENSHNGRDYGGHVSVGFYKYFRAHSSFSPFITLLPRFSMYYSYYGRGKSWKEYSAQTYSVSIDPGIEYFFGLMGKQLSLKFKTSLVKFSRTYRENNYLDVGDYSEVREGMDFYFPTGGKISTWLCFHF